MSSGSASSPFQMKHWPLASSICRRLRGLPVLHSCRARHHPISHGSTHRFKISSSPRPPHTHKLPAPLFTQGPPSTPLLSRPDCRPGHEDHMVLRIESGDSDVCSECWDKAVLFAAGTDPYVLMEEAVIVAAECSGTAKPLRAKTLPPTLDSFGWCSWDSFYSTVSAQGGEPGGGRERIQCMCVIDCWLSSSTSPCMCSQRLPAFKQPFPCPIPSQASTMLSEACGLRARHHAGWSLMTAGSAHRWTPPTATTRSRPSDEATGKRCVTSEG